MLPFTKRPARRTAPETSDMIHTGDIEVVRGGSSPKPSSRYPAPPSDRPRVFARSVSDDDDKTLMMPSKLRATIAPPRPANAPPSVRPVPPPSLKGLVVSPGRGRVDEERTMLRPASAEEQALLRPSSAPSKPSSRPPSPAMMPTPYMPFKPPVAAKKSAPPPPINAKGGSDKKAADSDARLEVPAAVITTKTRILPRKPSMSWAAALVALGVFTGLVTAVVARGDADSLLDATASLVDPTAARPAAAPPPVVQLPGAVVIPANAGGSSALPPGAATACGTDGPASPVAQAPAVNTPPPVAAATPTQTAAKPEPPKPPPVAWAAPRAYAPPMGAAPAAAPKPVAAPQPQPQPQAPAAVAAAPKPAPKAAPAAPAPKSGGSEMESAAAADALAKAQLEASLR